MRKSWIKVSDRLPELIFVDDNWEISEPMLVVRDGFVTIAAYEIFHGETRWSGYVHYNDITHWQPLELPDENI